MTKPLLRSMPIVHVQWNINQSSGALNWNRNTGNEKKTLGGRLRLSINTTIYHASIVKYVLALNRGKPEVQYNTLISFGKYLEMWKFH